MVSTLKNCFKIVSLFIIDECSICVPMLYACMLGESHKNFSGKSGCEEAVVWRPAVGTSDVSPQWELTSGHSACVLSSG